MFQTSKRVHILKPCQKPCQNPLTHQILIYNNYSNSCLYCILGVSIIYVFFVPFLDGVIKFQLNYKHSGIADGPTSTIGQHQVSTDQEGSSAGQLDQATASAGCKTTWQRRFIITC